MDLELGEHYNVTFTDPDVVKYAESFDANGYRISSAGELLPTPRTALGKEGVSIIACASTTQRTSVFIDALGQLDATRLPRDPAGHGESDAGDPPLRRWS